MAGCMQGLHGNALADLEDFAVLGGLRDGGAVLAADDGDLEGFEDLIVAACVVPVAVCCWSVGVLV